MNPPFPTGTVTFLFTDIEGSTKLAQEYPDTWEALRSQHNTIRRNAIESHHEPVVLKLHLRQSVESIRSSFSSKRVESTPLKPTW